MAVTVVSSAAPRLLTERLELRLPTAEDLWAMHAIVTDPATGRFLGSSHAPAHHFERFSRSAGSWLLYGYGSFILQERAGGSLIGSAGVFHSYRGLGPDFDDSPEAGWILRSDRVRRGLAREAMTAALAWFEREHGARRIVCMIAPENVASIGLAQALGFAAMRDAQTADGEAVRLFERLPAS